MFVHFALQIGTSLPRDGVSPEIPPALKEGKTLRSGNKSGEALEPSCVHGSCKEATKPCLLQSCGCCKLHHESICCAEFGACIMAFFYELRHDECKEERRLGG